MIISVTNYILLIGTAVFLVSIGCMITPSVSAQGITRVSKLPVQINFIRTGESFYR
jgi:hypothetical protein